MSAPENIFAIISFGVRKVIVHRKTEVLYVPVKVFAIRLATFTLSSLYNVKILFGMSSAKRYYVILSFSSFKVFES